MPQEFETDSFFAFRTPALPLSFALNWSEGLQTPTAQPEALPEAWAKDIAEMRSKLRQAILSPEIREAIFVASPDLEEMLPPWEQGTLSAEKQGRVERSLVRYLSRMASRSTPFGLFSGCATGTWAEATHLELSDRTSDIRHTRLDMDYLCALVEALEKDPVVRRTLRYRPNSSLYTAAGRFRYAEVRFDPDRGREHHLVGIEPTPYLEATLLRAEKCASIDELALPLVEDEGISLDEALEYINELIDNQVLVSNLYPTVTGEEPIRGVVRHLLGQPDTEQLGQRLGSVVDCLEALDQNTCERTPETYRRLAKELEQLPAKIKLKHLFQVDLVKQAPKAALGAKVRHEIEAAIERLRNLAPRRTQHPMKSFMEAFRERYESRWVPLLEVLDEECGIGYESSGNAGFEGAPLLQGLAMQREAEPTGSPFTRRDLFLLKHLMEAPGALEWELSDEDLERLKNPNPQSYPDAFSAMAILSATSQEALDEGAFELLLEHFSGPSGARLLGRFCHGDERLEDAVKAHLATEETLAPEAIFAEIVHLPEGRMGNILCRPLLRGYEIPYLGVSGAETEFQISLQDLQVSVVGDRVVLRSERLGKEIRPRLSTAHNYGRGLGVYRFLCRLQDQYALNSGWSWGNLEALPFLPRVRKGRHIISKARWRVERKELTQINKEEGSTAYKLFQTWKSDRDLPRMVHLVDADNTLLVDLENPLWLEMLLDLTKNRNSFELQECFQNENKLLAYSHEGRFCHELVIPFTKTKNKSNSTQKIKDTTTKINATSPSNRTFTPGSEWLYLKVYTGITTADHILASYLGPLLEECQDLFDRWFFIRYSEGGNHLRIRFKGDPTTLTTELHPRIAHTLSPLIHKGLCWKIQLDTYEREIERYGGTTGIELAEEFFWRDSQAVLGLVRAYPGDGGAPLRWRLGIKAIDTLWNGMGFDLSAKSDLVHRLRESFAKEFDGGGKLSIQLGGKFRKFRKELDQLIFELAHEETLQAGLSILEQRDQALTPCWDRLRTHAKNGKMSSSLGELASSFSHMHVNRLLRSAQRAQEFVIYDFLDRLYESRLARQRKAEGVRGSATVE